MNQSKFFLIFLIGISLIVPNTYAFDFRSAFSAGVDLITGDTVGTVVDTILAFKGDIEDWIFGTDKVNVPTEEDTSGTTQEELINNTKIANKLYSGMILNSTDKANEDIKALREMVSSKIIQWNTDDSGSIGDVVIKVYGPDKIYGYSVFPVRVNVYHPDTPDIPDPIHVQEVIISTNGNLWKRDITGIDDKLEGSSSDYYTLLKTPDEYAGTVKKLTQQGVPITNDIDNIIRSKVSDFEVYVTVKGYKEIWKLEGDDGHKHWVHERDEPFSVSTVTTNVGNLVDNGYYDVGGMVGSYPPSMVEQYKGRWTPYLFESQGSTSNILLRIWSNPCHILDSSASVKGFVLGNGNYLLLYPHSSDIRNGCYRVSAVRVLTGGNYEIASDVPGTISTYDDVQEIGTTITYNGGDDVVGFRDYIIVYGEIQRDDGIQLPVWMIARPKITVLDNTRSNVVSVTDDIAPLIEDNETSLADKIEIKKKLEDTALQLKDKIETAKMWEVKANDIGNNKAVECAKKAQEQYQNAIDTIGEVDLDDAQDVRDKLEKAKEYELSGDYWIDACKKYYSGLDDDAEISEENAEKVSPSSADSGIILFGDGGLIETLDDYISMIPGGWTTAIIGSVILIVLTGSGRYYRRR